LNNKKTQQHRKKEKDMSKQELGALQKENEELRAKLAEQENSRIISEARSGGSLHDEIGKIRKTQSKQHGAAGIVVKQHFDHKNITLWDRAGNSFGPMHPDNAERFLGDMAAAGVVLSVTIPTAEQVAAYKETPEYKKIEATEKKRREIKSRSRRSGNFEKLIAIMEKQFGVPASQLNAVLKPEDVGMKK